MISVWLYNKCHNTSTKIRVDRLPIELTAQQAKRIKRRLCPDIDCICSNITLGTFGQQVVKILQTDLDRVLIDQK